MKNITQYILESLTEESQIGILAKYIYDTLYYYVENNDFNADDVIEIRYKDIKGFDPNRYNLIKTNNGKRISKKSDIFIYFEKEDKYTFGSMLPEFATMMLNPIHFNSIRKIKKNKANIMNTLMHELTHFIQFHKFSIDRSEEEKKKDLKTAMSMGGYDEIINNAIANEDHTKPYSYYMGTFIIYSINKTECDARVIGFVANLDTDWNELIKQFKKENKLKTVKDQKLFTATNFINYIFQNNKYDNLELHIKYFNEYLDAIKKDTWDQYYKDYEELDFTKHHSPIYVFLNSIDHRSNLDDYNGLTLPLPGKNNCTSQIHNKEQFNEFRNKFIESFEKQYDRYVKKIMNKIYQKWESEIKNENPIMKELLKV